MTSDKQLSITLKTIAPVIAVANGLEIVDTVSMKVAVEFLSEANKYLDSVVEWKEKKTKPLNEALKVIRSETKPMESALTEAIENVREKMTNYQTNLVKIQQEAQAKIAAKVSSGYIKIETGVKKLEEVVTPDKEVSTNSGLVQFREVKVLKITDITAIPHEYFDLNEKKVLDALKAGVVVPGVEIEIKMVPANYR